MNPPIKIQILATLALLCPASSNFLYNTVEERRDIASGIPNNKRNIFRLPEKE